MSAALDALVARHAPLRSTFIPMDGEPMQWVGEPYHVDLDLVVNTLSNDSAALREALTDFALEPFNLETGPLLRARLYRLADDEHILAVAEHHPLDAGQHGGPRTHRARLHGHHEGAASQAPGAQPRGNVPDQAHQDQA